MRVDDIRREILIDASIERVWEALTSAEQISQWFGDSAEIDLRPGGRARIGWTEFDAMTDCIVEVVDRPTRFSFRWDALKDTPLDVVSTLVEFTLVPEGDGTRLTLLESGFADLPDEAYQARIDENSAGWDFELEDLRGYLTGVRPVA